MNSTTNSLYDNELVNLTDMWDKAGRNPSRAPSKWRKLTSTKRLIRSSIKVDRSIIKVKHGWDGSTWAIEKLAEAYQLYLNKPSGKAIAEVEPVVAPAEHDKMSYNGVAINFADDFINLTDMWKASGLSVHVTPPQWLRLPETKKFLEHLEDVNMGLSHVKSFIKTKQGKHGGTYGHWQLAISYAKYLSPEFHVWANQAIKDRMEEDHDPELGINRSKSRAIEKWQKQGWSDSRIAARLAGIDTRNTFTSMLAKHGITGYDFKSATNSTYIALFGGNAKDLRQDRDLPAKANLRDHMTKVELSAVQLVEAMASEVIEDEGRHGVRDCCRAIVKTGAAVAPALEKFKRLKAA